MRLELTNGEKTRDRESIALNFQLGFLKNDLTVSPPSGIFSIFLGTLP